MVSISTNLYIKEEEMLSKVDLTQLAFVQVKGLLFYESDFLWQVRMTLFCQIGSFH